VVLVGYAVYGVGGAGFALAFAVFGLAVLDELGARRAVAAESESEPEEESDVERRIGDRRAAGWADGQPGPMPAPTPGQSPEAMGSAGQRAGS